MHHMEVKRTLDIQMTANAQREATSSMCEPCLGRVKRSSLTAHFVPSKLGQWGLPINHRSRGAGRGQLLRERLGRQGRPWPRSRRGLESPSRPFTTR